MSNTMFIDNDSGDMVNCSISQEISVTSSKKSLIRCERNIETGELILGHKESVRGITPGALGHLLEATSISNQPLSRSGQLEFHINLNMVRLDAKCFQDLGGLITDIRLLNTVYMHPDSLIDLQHLRSFEIESGQTPLYLSDDDDHGVNDNSKNDTYMMEVDDLVKPDSIKKPAFIRLHPLDNTVPISFNLNTKCHQCDLQSDSSDVDGNSSSSRSGSSSSSSSSSSGSKSLRSIQKTDNLIIIVFTSKRDLPSTGQQISPKLSMIFPYTCPVIIDGIGCPKQSDLITMNHEGSKSSFNIPVIEQLKTITFIQSESKHTLSLSIILIIWCTIITKAFY
ncbi:unnamed protein product [Heterobilharzia americana]|nr:unnamed protein product [Heterobilharzia americana]